MSGSMVEVAVEEDVTVVVVMAVIVTVAVLGSVVVVKSVEVSQEVLLMDVTQDVNVGSTVGGKQEQPVMVSVNQISVPLLVLVLVLVGSISAVSVGPSVKAASSSEVASRLR